MSKTSLVSSTLQALMIYSDLWCLKPQTSNHTGVLYTSKQSDAPEISPSGKNQDIKHIAPKRHVYLQTQLYTYLVLVVLDQKLLVCVHYIFWVFIILFWMILSHKPCKHAHLKLLIHESFLFLITCQTSCQQRCPQEEMKSINVHENK